MIQQGRQGENKCAVNFHPNSHTHMHIHRTNSNHPKPVAFFFLPLPLLYNTTNPDGNTPNKIVENYGSKGPNSALLSDLFLIPKKEEGRGGCGAGGVRVGGWGVGTRRGTFKPGN